MSNQEPDGLPKGPGHFDRFNFKNESGQPVHITFEFLDPNDPTKNLAPKLNNVPVGDGQDYDVNFDPEICVVDIVGTVSTPATAIPYQKYRFFCGLNSEGSVAYKLMPADVKSGLLVVNEDISTYL